MSTAAEIDARVFMNPPYDYVTNPVGIHRSSADDASDAVSDLVTIYG